MSTANFSNLLRFVFIWTRPRQLITITQTSTPLTPDQFSRIYLFVFIIGKLSSKKMFIFKYHTPRNKKNENKY